jgi:S1-C subfamily serine protease
MRIIIVLALGLLPFLPVTLGQIPSAKHVPFLGIEDVAGKAKKTVFSIQINVGAKEGSKDQQWKPLGSGFFVKGTGDPNTLLGITCEHIVAESEKANKPIFIGLSTDKGYRRFKCKVLSRDQKIDVAVLAFLEDPNDKIKLRPDVTMVFPPESFGDANSLIEGCGVIIAGFPLGLGVEVDKEYPVIRMGIVAQYTGKKTFLIDCVANPGTSGSPVIAVKFEKNQLLGMITSYKPDFIDLFDDKHNLAARLPYNAGLAQAVTADEILKCIAKVKY